MNVGSNNLHSNLVIFKFGAKELAKSVTVTIYIPIWWYSNLTATNAIDDSTTEFTFQSGDIQMIFWILGNMMSLQFTFQSGDIQIFLIFNDVVFIIVFTFQSGDIQITEMCSAQWPVGNNLHSNLVIFKFINNLSNDNKFIKIYIPIWWYSNTISKFEKCPCIDIYIPIWWYSNSSSTVFAFPKI